MAIVQISLSPQQLVEAMRQLTEDERVEFLKLLESDPTLLSIYRTLAASCLGALTPEEAAAVEQSRRDHEAGRFLRLETPEQIRAYIKAL